MGNLRKGHPEYLTVVDLTVCDRHARGYWSVSRFLDKIKGLKFPHLLFTGDYRGVLSRIRRDRIYVVIYIEGGQLFFDTGLVKAAIKKFRRYAPDYYTQWEHSRIPVGVGVRIFSAKSLLESNAGSFGEQMNDIMKNPERFSIRYEDEASADYQLSRLDSRYSARLSRYIDGKGKGLRWDMKGFADLANAYPSKLPIYKTPVKAARMDERGMPAPYGFESAECADFPGYIMFDVTNLCNSRCIHCPHSITYSRTGSRPVFIGADIFKKAIDEAAGIKSCFIRITADGEPLLHKDLAGMIEYAVHKGVRHIGLTTNGMLMTGDVAARLMDSGLFMVDFSLDAVRAETYRKIRQGLSFEKVVGNVESTIRLRDKKASPLKIMVSFVRQKDNADEEKEFIARWKNKVDKVLIREMISNINLIKTGGGEKPNAVKRWPCTHVFRRIVINYNGVMKMCPVDWENATSYEPVDIVSMRGAWHSNFYWRNRIEHLNSDFRAKSVCGGCSDWQGSPWDLGYEKVVKEL